MLRLGSLLFAFALAGGSAAAEPLGDAAILPSARAGDLLHQCSRTTPQPGEGVWTPAAADIAALEVALPAALETRAPADSRDWSRAPQGWRRQYVGLVRGGRRYIYGNFFPAGAAPWDERDRWRREPVIVCDGGPGFFGVEYDVEARRFSHFGFNGSA